QKDRPVSALREAFDSEHDPIVFLADLVGGGMKLRGVALRKNEPLDPQPIRAADQYFHALFGAVARDRMEMAMDVPNSDARGFFRLTLKQPRCAPGAKRTEKTSPTEHSTHDECAGRRFRLPSRQSEAQNVGASGDRYVLTPSGRVSHGSRLDRVVSRDMPQTLSFLLIDGHQISV